MRCIVNEAVDDDDITSFLQSKRKNDSKGNLRQDSEQFSFGYEEDEDDDDETRGGRSKGVKKRGK